MELSKMERWILANQYRILEKLYPEEAEGYANIREVLESGYELNYSWLCPQISDASDTLSAEGCSEVIDIMDMFSQLKFSYERLGKDSGIDEKRIEFPGFSGNDEGKQWGYALFLYEREGKFQRLNRGDRLNSHFPLLPRYRAMLEEWKQSADRNELSKDDIIRIISVKKGSTQ